MFGYGGLCITGNLEGHCVSLNWIAPFMCKGNFSKARATTEAGFRQKANVKAHEFLGFEAGTTVSPAQSDQSMDACPEKYLSLLCLSLPAEYFVFVVDAGSSRLGCGSL